ncbi:MAG TPA: SDR family oxidoreductase [Alphaproteobacteria bacterium]|nr:SDR family oxidoreductase [Alphaproteobacteria bacterium]
MKILVTGGCGYVGSQVTAHLLAEGHTVRVFDGLLYGAEPLLPFASHPKFELVVGDVRKADQLKAAMDGMEACVHFAAMVSEQACKAEPAYSWAVNHDAVKTISDLANGRLKKLIFISTCSNYGVSAPGVEADEDAPLNPLSDYARAKVAAEKFLLEHSTVPAFTTLRFSTICGLSGRMRFDLLVNEIAREAVMGRPVQIYAPQAWRPYLHAYDAARAVATVLGAAPEQVHKKTFNIVSENLRKIDLLDIAKKHVPNVKHTIVEKAPDLRDYQVSGARFEKAFNFKCTRTIEAAFVEVADAVKNGLFRDPDEVRHTALAYRLPV